MITTEINITGVNKELLTKSLEKEYGCEYTFSSKDILVMIREEFYFRISSNLLTTIILDLSNEDTCHIEITSGGGAYGIIGIDWGAEGSNNKKIVKFIKKLCEDNKWEIENITNNE
ncbi:hypothetical protein [Oceanirhabdus sp. W0125-5]|uniref:hypothetical protein n=1 Tax=Oceanirhabdus sp. W0125-5 TaxID=2999116 RepID=UPI0022F2BC54|nr:hypothetical protein [Oceanirhabdus sp. W0125-5]WBW95657.1 hypothetical protein OW730_18435 [Oceanirhabdus sp. W0125-5]